MHNPVQTNTIVNFFVFFPFRRLTFSENQPEILSFLCRTFSSRRWVAQERAVADFHDYYTIRLKREASNYLQENRTFFANPIKFLLLCYQS